MPYSSRPRTWGAKSASTERWLNKITSGDDSDFTGTSIQTSPRLQIRSTKPPARPISPTRLGLTYELHLPITKLDEIRILEAQDDYYYLDRTKEESTSGGDSGITTYNARSWARKQVVTGKSLPSVAEAPQESPRDVLRALSRSLNSNSSASTTREIECQVDNPGEVVTDADDEGDNNKADNMSVAANASASNRVSVNNTARPDMVHQSLPAVPSTPELFKQAPLTPELTPEVPAKSHHMIEASNDGDSNLKIHFEAPSTPDTKERTQPSTAHEVEARDPVPSTPRNGKQSTDLVLAQHNTGGGDIAQLPIDNIPVATATALAVKPTPRVTGAYLETPTRPPGVRTPYTRGRVSSAPTISTRVSTTPLLQETLARPPLINTAKITTAAEDLIALQAQLDGSQFDHSDFLRGFVSGKFTSSHEPRQVLGTQKEVNELSLSAKELERNHERLALERMTQSMKKTSSSIRDARHGIERLEQQVATSIKSPRRTPANYISYRWISVSFVIALVILISSVLIQPRRQSTVDDWEPYTPWFRLTDSRWTRASTASDYWGESNRPVGIVHEEVFGIWDDERL